MNIVSFYKTQMAINNLESSLYETSIKDYQRYMPVIRSSSRIDGITNLKIIEKDKRSLFLTFNVSDSLCKYIYSYNYDRFTYGERIINGNRYLIPFVVESEKKDVETKTSSRKI